MDTKKDHIKRAVELMLEAQKDDLHNVKVKADSKMLQDIIAMADKYNANIKKDPIMLKHIAKLDSLNIIPEELYPTVAEILAGIYNRNKTAGVVLS